MRPFYPPVPAKPDAVLLSASKIAFLRQNFQMEFVVQGSIYSTDRARAADESQKCFFCPSCRMAIKEK
jgi:hypothetical protein